MRRREFIALFGVAATTYPLPLRAQQRGRMRRIGVLMPFTEDNPEAKARLAAFTQALQGLGWTVGRNLQIEYRWIGGNAENIRKYATELVELSPDVIVTDGSSTVAQLLQLTRTVPIVLPVVGDPVGAGFVKSLARPGGNVTGFMTFESTLAGKWLELLKEVAPNVKRVAVFHDATIPSGVGEFRVIQAASPSVGAEVSPLSEREATQIERAFAAFAHSANGGLIVSGSALAVQHRSLIAALAVKYKLPSVCSGREFATAGCLIGYGPDVVDQYRRSASYVDRILKGEKPADLPVQAPTKFELAINLKTAKELGLTVPPTLLARATEVIE